MLFKSTGPATQPQRICLVCAKPVLSIHKHVKFCSAACYHASRVGKTSQVSTKVEKTCQHCGKPFMLCPSTARTAKFCSTACKYSAITSLQIERQCLTCGKSFMATESDKSRYCSLPCFWRTLADRLWSRVNKTDTCWLWTGHIKPNGYGVIGNKGETRYVHIVAWELANGSVPDGRFVLHRCDVRNCCFPGHLFLGDNQTNMDDMMAKCRHRQTGALLNMGKAEEIRQKYATGNCTQHDLSQEYGVGIKSIWRILQNKSYAATASTPPCQPQPTSC